MQIRYALPPDADVMAEVTCAAFAAVNERARRFYACLGGVLAGKAPPGEVFYVWQEIGSRTAPQAAGTPACRTDG